jgi:uncharacterized membrane protein
MEKTRLELFSDAVIAIIITIMVLEMKVPHGAEWGNLLTILPKFISYILSFLFIAIYWVNHHHLLHTVKIATSAIMWANINLLFWLSLVPFATAWMGENHFEKQTVVAYSVLALFCALAFNLLQRAIVKDHKRLKNLEEIIKPKGWKSLGSVILYALAIPTALFVSAAIAGGIFFLVAVIWFIPDKKIEKVENAENANH